MHKITVSVAVSSIKIKLFNDFKEGFVNRIIEKLRKKKKSQKGNNIFWVGPFLVG